MFTCPEYCIGNLLLLIRHTGIERLEGRDLTSSYDLMGFGNLTVVFHMLDSVHGLTVFSPVLGKSVHVFRIIRIT